MTQFGGGRELKFRHDVKIYKLTTIDDRGVGLVAWSHFPTYTNLHRLRYCNTSSTAPLPSFRQRSDDRSALSQPKH